MWAQEFLQLKLIYHFEPIYLDGDSHSLTIYWGGKSIAGYLGHVSFESFFNPRPNCG